MRLSHKAMLLIAVPLVSELIFVVALVTTLNNLERNYAREKSAREISMAINITQSNMLQSVGSLGLYHVYGKQRYMDQYHEAINNLRTQNDRLTELMGQDTPPELVSFKNSITQFITTFDETDSLVQTHDRMDLMRSMVRVQRLLKTVHESGSRVIERRLELDAQQSLVQSRLRAQLQAIIWFGVACSIFLAAGLATYFNRTTSRRFEVLLGNTSRFAMERTLQPPLEGTDEMASLDKSFHAMAAAVAESRRKEQALTENALDIICSLDTDYNFSKINQAVESTLGYQPVELIGQSFFSVVSEKDKQRARATLDKIAASASELPLELGMRRNDQFSCEMLWSVRWSAIEKSFFCVGHDISERKQVERLKQDVIAMVSHDLRSPLTSLRATFDMLQMGAFGDLNERGTEKVKQSEHVIGRMVSMINDLLYLEKLESGIFELKKSDETIQSLIQQSVSAVQSTAEMKKIALSVTCPDAKVYCDGERIIRVLINLLDNAMKFSKPGDIVTVSVELLNGAIEIDITDQGMGIPPDKLETIFERFRQVDRDDEISRHGSGLGLAICKGIIEAHEGSIGVRSTVGSGSTFWIRLLQQKANQVPALEPEASQLIN